MSLKVTFNLPPSTHVQANVKSQFMTEPIEGLFTERMREALLVKAATDILLYKTSIGLMNASDPITATFMVAFKQQCEDDLVMSFLRLEEGHQGVMLNVVLKCKTKVLSGAPKKKLGVVSCTGDYNTEKKKPMIKEVVSTPRPYASIPTSPLYPLYRSEHVQVPTFARARLHKQVDERAALRYLKHAEFKSRAQKCSQSEFRKKMIRFSNSVKGKGKGKLIFEAYDPPNKMTYNLPSVPKVEFDEQKDPLCILARKSLPSSTSGFPTSSKIGSLLLKQKQKPH